MKRIIFICCFLLLALPASSFATGSVAPSYSDLGGSEVGGGGGYSAAAGYNDLIDRGRNLLWNRGWSARLIDGEYASGEQNPLKIGGWCQSRSNFAPTVAELDGSELGKRFKDATRSTSPEGRVTEWNWRPVASGGVAAYVSTGTCLSPMAVWGHGGSRSIEDARYAYPDGTIASEPSRNTSQYKAWAYLKQAAAQIGYQNRCRVPSSLRSSPNSIGEECRYVPQYLVGKKSESEQIPTSPDDTSKVLQVGAANTAIVRIWRECAHKYPEAAGLPVGAKLEALGVSGGEYAYKEQGSKDCNEVKDNQIPSFERVPPVATVAANPGCATEFSPFHGILTSAADSVCAGQTSRLFNYFNTDSPASGSGRTEYPASISRRENAFLSASASGARTAGVLFGNCTNPKGTSNVSRGQTAYCLNPARGGNPIGRAKPGSTVIDDNKTFESQCNDGPMAGGNWNWYDYAAQLSQKMTAGANNGGFAYKTSDSRAVKKGKADLFIEMFKFWNPPLRKQLESGLFDGTDNLQLLKQLQSEFGDGPTFPEGQWLPKVPMEALLKGNIWDRRSYKDAACNVFTDWMSANWKLGSKETQSVTVNLQPIPNRLYLIQVVMLDQRENIISQSLQFAGGFAAGQLPAVNPVGTPVVDPLRCRKYSAYLRGAPFTDADYFEYNEGDIYPPICTGSATQTTEVGPAPAASTFSSSQPQSQISGQNWPLWSNPNFSLFGGFQAAADGSPSAALPEGTPSGSGVVENKEMAKLWQPRALAASVFNPDNYKKRASSGYLQSHRIETLSDKYSEIDTMDRFALKGNLLTIPKPGDLGWVGDPSKSGDSAADWAPANEWFQAKLPLLSDGSNLFFNYWSVSSANPTRAPEELTDTQTGIRQEAVFAARNQADPGPAQKATWAYEASRSKVDETRFGSLLGEGRFIWQNSIDQVCASPSDPESDPDCSEVAPAISSKWRRLTSDKCEGADQPQISINNARPKPCNPDAEVGAGWKVKDAYQLPALSASYKLADDGPAITPQVELASVFRTDRLAPAHLQLDSLNIPEQNVSKVAIWSLERFLGRVPVSIPDYQTAAGADSISFCTNPAARRYKAKDYQPQYSAQFSRTVNHVKQSQLTSENLLEYGTSPSTVKRDYIIDPGSSLDQTDGKWWTFTPSSPGSPNYNGEINTWSPGAAEAKKRVGDLLKDQQSGEVWKFAGDPNGDWKAWGPNGITNGDNTPMWLRHAVAKWKKRDRADWWGYKTDGANWSGVDGNSWWFGPEDLGQTNLYNKVLEQGRYTEYDAVEEFANCSDLPQYSPNAKVGGSSDLSPELPAGDWVVVFTVQGPLGVSPALGSTDWGIKGHYSQSEKIQWVNSFNLQQTSGRTAIYRYRPTG